MARPIVRRGVAVGLGALWWWAALRLAFAPGAGPLEAAVAAGGWSVSLLPVHCVPRAQAAGAVGPERWRNAWRAARFTTALPLRRSDAGSGPS
jgi:hypothetical protein